MTCRVLAHLTIVHRISAVTAWVLALCVFCTTVEAQLRIVTYNTAGGPRPEMEVIFRAIGEEDRNGIARPIDVLLLQEQTSWSTTTQDLADMLNGIYGTGLYGLAMLDGDTTGSGRPGLVFNTTTVQLIDSIAVGTASLTGQPRQTLRYQLRPIGFDSSADFYAYNSHYKSDTGSENQDRRLVEATAIRQNADALGQGAHVIYAGDHNMYGSSEPAFQALLGAGPGQAFDPINRLGDWSFNSSFADVHTQAPCSTNCGGLTSGGMDDRFDFQLVTDEFLDGQGLDYVVGSYRAFGNAGGTFNDDINAGCDTVGGCLNGYSFTGVTSYTKAQILNALHTASDHIPVVADFNLPDSDPIPQPQVIARWTFEAGAPGNPPSGSGSTISAISPAEGTGTASGFHASDVTTWDNPAGNGSPEAFSSNGWAVGDYYEFQTSSDGLENLLLTFDQVSSATGPREFQLSYSIDGTAFTDFGSVYMVRANSSPSWSSASVTELDTFSFDLGSVTALNDQADIFIRLVVASTVSANGGMIGSGGTSRLDNVSIIGTPIANLDGDFNDDGSVDAADYVMWRKSFSGNGAAYDDWVTNFGRTHAGSGGGSSHPLGTPAVPEPAAWLLLTFGIYIATMRRGTLAAWTRKP